MQTKRVGPWAMAAFLLGACGGAEPEASSAESSSGSERPQTSEALTQHMRANFRLAIEARDALVDGNLVGAKAKASELAAQDYTGDLPDSWQGGVQAMQTAARAITDAKDLNDAALHMAELALSCGSCHAQLTTGAHDKAEHATFATGGAEDISTRMARHLRAADEMWFGLSMPSEASWHEGARVLSEAPEDIPNIEGEPADPALGAQMEIIRELGARAKAADGGLARVAVYGELLGKCATCHAPTP